MAIVEHLDYQPLAMEEDPDDFRPDSELAIVIDPTDAAGDSGAPVRDLTVFCERIAPGDRIPFHVHDVDEVLFIDEGSIEVRLGDSRRLAGPGAIVFVPARVGHGFHNVGEAVARIHAVFPSDQIAIRYLERNPAPGTEGEEPGPPLTVDARELLEGDAGRAIRPADPAALRQRSG